MPSQPDALTARAAEVFAHGFAFTRGLVYPCNAERVGSLWVVRDQERKRGGYRNEEWVAIDAPAAEVHEAARTGTRGRYLVCAICTGDQTATRQAYKALGYRLMSTEPLMVHTLKRIPALSSPAEVQRLQDAEAARQLNRKAGARWISPEHFADNAPIRQYVALLDGAIVGWVQSVVAGNSTWCANMFVEPPFRRRGIARAMLCRMLRDDRKHGSTLAVLLASHTGALLYPSVGYEQIDTLLLYSPRKSVPR